MRTIKNVSAKITENEHLFLIKMNLLPIICSEDNS